MYLDSFSSSSVSQSQGVAGVSHLTVTEEFPKIWHGSFSRPAFTELDGSPRCRSSSHSIRKSMPACLGKFGSGRGLHCSGKKAMCGPSAHPPILAVRPPPTHHHHHHRHPTSLVSRELIRWRSALAPIKLTVHHSDIHPSLWPLPAQDLRHRAWRFHVTGCERRLTPWLQVSDWRR